MGKLIRMDFITHLAALLVGGLLFGALAWFFQAARIGADLSDARLEVAEQKHQKTEERLAGEMRARQLEDHFNAKDRESARVASLKERADAQRLADLRADRDRMRDERDEALANFAKADAQAQLEYVTALDAVFGECSERYEAMAGAAAGHARDAQRLWDAWNEWPEWVERPVTGD